MRLSDFFQPSLIFVCEAGAPHKFFRQSPASMFFRHRHLSPGQIRQPLQGVQEDSGNFHHRSGRQNGKLILSSEPLAAASPNKKIVSIYSQIVARYFFTVSFQKRKQNEERMHGALSQMSVNNIDVCGSISTIYRIVSTQNK